MKKITLCALVHLFFPPLSLYSQNEFLDETFGTNGIIFQSYTDPQTGHGFESDFKSIVLQPDGKFITTSNFHLHGSDPRYVIARYNNDGTIDRAFGENGFVASDVNYSIGNVKLQSDGKIIGFATEGIYPSFNRYLFRYNADGSLDDSFGTNGAVTDTVNSIRLISVQSDDKILVGKMPGNAWSLPSFTVERYKPDGTLDSDFGNNGEIVFSLPQANVSLRGIESQADRKILLRVVRAPDPGDYQSDILFVRLNDNGSLDTTFGEAGLRVFNFDYADYASNVLVQSDGKIIFFSLSYGLSSDISERVIRLIRLNEDGDLDGSFGADGIRIMEYPFFFPSPTQLENGKLMAVGTYFTSEDPDPENNYATDGIAIALYNWNGDLDRDFGQNGYIITTLPYSRALYSQLVIQRDGKILVGASFCEALYSCHPHTVVFRYNPEQRLSVSELDKNNVFMVYPNPFKESVTIDFTLNQPEVLSMDLYSFDGRKVTALLKDQGFKAGFNSQKLDFSGTLAAGIYFITVSSENETKNFRIVKK